MSNWEELLFFCTPVGASADIPESEESLDIIFEARFDAKVGEVNFVCTDEISPLDPLAVIVGLKPYIMSLSFPKKLLLQSE